MDSSVTVPEGRRCSYCGRVKPNADFSYEHIWPDGLGGDYLPDPWKTYNVCQRCNSLSGQFVDGEFIKSWFGSHERAASADLYRDPEDPNRGIHPLRFIGPIEHAELRDDEVAEMWLGPCGAHCIHIRPRSEPLWDTYAGGKPSRKRADWGTAFLALTSTKHYWVIASVLAFQNHFRRADRIVTNMNPPEGFSPPFSHIDPENADQARMLRVAQSVGEAAALGNRVSSRIMVRQDLGGRLLAKIALGLGRELLGEVFLDTPYAGHLRAALWERDFQARQSIPVRGTGYNKGLEAKPGMDFLSWPGAWALTVWKTRGELVLIIGSPSGKIMTVMMSDDRQLTESLNSRFDDGRIYIAVPALGRAVSLSLPDFLAHRLGNMSNPDLAVLKASERDPAMLPACR